MGDPHVLELREQLAEQVAAQLDFAVGQVEVVAQLAGKLVAAAGAEHQAVVGRALAVGDLAAAFAEGLARLRPISSQVLRAAARWRRSGSAPATGTAQRRQVAA
jgi:hypothetical protein